jgi:methyl-accepting chemotaxis protein
MKSLTMKRLTTKGVKANHFFQVRRIFWETRTYIFLWYLVVMVVFIGLSVPFFSILILRQVNARVEEELGEELKAFDTLIEEQKRTEEGLTNENLPKFLKYYLSVRLPEDDTFLITILDGDFLSSSPRALPNTVWESSELMNYFLQLDKSERNRYKTSDPNIGDIMYLTRPVIAEGQIRGLFVVLHTTAGEREEIVESETTVIKVLFIVLFFALILAWIASGKILAPLRSLSTTALAISESDLSQRISIKGTGEMAEVAMTFNTMMDRLEAAFTSQQALIKDASHELRTPITIIDCYLEQLQPDSQEQKKIVTLLKDELNRMNRLVNDLLLLAKAERPDFLNREIVEIGSLTEQLYNKATTLAKRN